MTVKIGNSHFIYELKFIHFVIFQHISKVSEKQHQQANNNYLNKPNDARLTTWAQFFFLIQAVYILVITMRFNLYLLLM